MISGWRLPINYNVFEFFQNKSGLSVYLKNKKLNKTISEYMILQQKDFKMNTYIHMIYKTF